MYQSVMLWSERTRGRLLRGAALMALSTAAALFATLAAAASFDPEATIKIGSLAEPQNLDNTAGAGQGINEAFNGNVYEALFQLTDKGRVENSW